MARRTADHELRIKRVCEPAVAHLLALLKAGPATLLYGARDVAHNQAVVLAGYIRELALSR
jgi:uncharacterized protein YeaO (DUF488 family)